LYDRVTNFHNINNIIWVWNSIAEDWYPGDDTVDILSADVYATGNGVGSPCPSTLSQSDE
jgi:mannan endo-1,4-beta-mannosidase